MRASHHKVLRASPTLTTQRRRVVGLDDRVPLLMYTTEQAAQALGISVSAMKKLIARGPDYGGVFSLKVGGLRRVPVWALDAYTRPKAGQQSA